jgi:hypothetical protein
MTRARDVADTQDNLGGAVPPFVAGKNFIINGGFDIWQRGTSFASGGASGSYGPDRWQIGRGSASVTLSRQSTGAPIGTQYYSRQTSTGNSSYFDLDTYIETSNVAQLWGRVVTFSVKLRGNATQATNTGNTMTFDLEKSSTTDAGIGATWTKINGVAVVSSAIPVGTTSADWMTASFTATVPNDGTANSLRIISQYNGTGNVNGSIFDIGAVQLEVGSVATPFSRAGGTIQGELAACQRYYYRTTATNYATYSTVGNAFSTTQGVVQTRLPVTMRIPPTAVDFTTLQVYSLTNSGQTTVTGLGINGNSTDNPEVIVTVGSGLTSGNIINLRYNGAGSYLGFSAEL